MLVLGLACWAATEAGGQTPITGTVTHVKDGDTICVGNMEVRLEGVDAPEADHNRPRGHARWTCGKAATQALRGLAAGRSVTCQPKYCDAYGRTVALCRINGADLSETMVSAGWAVDWPYYSRGGYAAAQETARRVGKGLWADGSTAGRSAKMPWHAGHTEFGKQNWNCRGGFLRCCSTGPVRFSWT
jgi:endonuclease YncB( thermonuclease family)